VPLLDQIDHAALTDVGIRRSHNQDAFQIQKAVDRDHWLREGHIFIVADGMGGHAVGEKASAKAAREIPLIYAKHVQEGPMVALRRAFQETNAGIHAIGQENPEFRGLGTTGTALILREDGAWIAHVGDSRVYRVRTGQIEQLSFDHSYVWEMARRLNIPPEELADVKKNVIIRSLGPDPLVQVDIEGPHPLESGDTFVLCSDGLSNLVEPEEIGAVTAAFPTQEAARLLLEIANLRGGPDNITVVIVKIGANEPSVVSESVKVAKPTFFANAVQKWKRRVPIAINILLLGFLFAVICFISMFNDWSGKFLWFVLSGLLIAGGLVMLMLQARKQQLEDEKESDKPRKLNVYRQYECHIHPDLVEKFRKLAEDVKQHMESNNVAGDWKTYQKHHDVAEKAWKESDLLTSFREACRGLFLLAKTYNSSRQKGEGFNPRFGPGNDWT
jgi:PPM family protein phosphatase